MRGNNGIRCSADSENEKMCNKIFCNNVVTDFRELNLRELFAITGRKVVPTFGLTALQIYMPKKKNTKGHDFIKEIKFYQNS